MTNETRAAADARARERALDVARSFIVQAPAGSGKTELLIQRYLALLARVDSPEEIVAITFTRKAATEMRNRVLAALAVAEADAPPCKPHEEVTRRLAKAVAARDAEARWALVENPGRLRIQTIDALCAWLTRHLPVLSGFGAQPAIVEKADELHAEAAQRTLAGLDAGQPWSAFVARTLAHLDNDMAKAQGLIANMLARRDQWLRHVADRASPRIRRETLEEALANAVRDVLASLAALLPEEARAALPGLAACAAENLEAAGRESPIRDCRGVTAVPGAEPADLDVWRGIAELLLTGGGELRKTVTEAQGFLSASSAKGTDKDRRQALKTRFDALIRTLAPHRTFIELLEQARSLPPAAYSDVQWQVVEALAGLLPVAVAQLEVLFKERGEVDFTQVAQAAVRALGREDAPTDLALALDYRIRHILVDEFQDTSFSQFELLERLTAGWQPGDGRTLFVVGDPMQSIYRFREAEVGLYLRARHEGIGGIALEPLTLALNFRSQQGIVEWVNATFRAVLPDAEDLASGAVPFVASDAARSARDGAAVSFHPFLAMDREGEARLVVEQVKAAQSENPQQKVAILVRNRSHLAAIAPGLQGAGLRFQAIEIEELGHRPVVQDLLALTRALTHPADRIAWLSVLRAPWCGLTLADLDALAVHDRDKAVWDLIGDDIAASRLSPDGRQRLARVREVVGQALARRRREPLRRWVESAWLALGGPACAEDATDLEDAQVFLKLLDELEEGGDLPALEMLAERVAALYALPDTEADTRLQVMTIHKAKGLEFDTVIVPGLGFAPRRKESRLLLWLERPRGRAESDLLLAPVKEASEQTDAIYRYLDRLDDVKEAHEDARLVYVAATRAKTRLHLVGQVEWKGNDLKPKSKSLLERLWPAVASEFEQAVAQAGGAPQPDTAPPAARPHAIRRFVPGWQLPTPPAGLAWKLDAEVAHEAKSPHDEVEFSWASETARHAGTVVHNFLQLIAEEGLQRWSAERIGKMRAVFARDLAREGVPDSEMKSAVARIAEALAASLADERGRWVLGAHPEAQSELRLSGAIDGGIVSVAMDRTFVDNTGTRWIVDYKTGVHEGGDLEGFLDREQERYRKQLEQYAALMRGMDDRPIRLGLYFPLLNGWREWALAVTK